MPPHVTLIFPFADSADVDPLIPAVGAELEAFAPFAVAFRDTGRFPGTLYLEPEPAAPFVAMTEALVQAFPEFPLYAGEFEEIVPHVSVAQGDEALLDRVEEGLPALGDVTARVERAWLVEDRPEGWRRHTAFPLDRHERVTR
jgi:2'-5' RNA ligase